MFYFNVLQVLLWKITQNTTYKNDIEATFNEVWCPGGELHYTPGGLAWRLQWGSNRYSGIVNNYRFRPPSALLVKTVGFTSFAPYDHVLRIPKPYIKTLTELH